MIEQSNGSFRFNVFHYRAHMIGVDVLDKRICNYANDL